MIYDYFFNVETVNFIEGNGYAFVNKNRFDLSFVPVKSHEDLYVALEDIRKIWAPYMTVKAENLKAEIVLDGITAEVKAGSAEINVNAIMVPLSQPVELIENTLCLPVSEFMGKIYHKTVCASKENGKTNQGLRDIFDNLIISVSNKEDYIMDNAVLSMMDQPLQGKNDGELFCSYWLPEADKIIPYSVYVPYKYDPSVQTKLIVCLHGGGIAEQGIYNISEGMIQYYCEKYNYILLCPNAGPMHSTYGCLTPPCGRPIFPITDPDNLENPCGFDEEQLYSRKLGEICVDRAIKIIKDRYNIDEEHMYLMGNSMGGLGTFYYASRNMGEFKAIAPSGATLDPKYFDYTRLCGLPIRLVAGTEDYSFVTIKKGYHAMVNAGLDIDFCVVGGGVHMNSWARELKGTFEFFEAHK